MIDDKTTNLANAPLYDAAANSAGCYADAIAAIRLRLVRDGDVVPREDEPVPLSVLRVI